jgi:hypothetical protein
VYSGVEQQGRGRERVKGSKQKGRGREGKGEVR